MVVAAIAAEGLIQAMGALTGALKESFAFSDNAQKASLSLGMTFQGAQEKLGGSMEGLRGSLDQRFGAALQTLEAGMRGNTAGVAKLINQQQLTGTASANTAKAFASLQAVMGQSNEATNQLASDLIETGNKYGISSDKLVNAINSMDKSMTQFNVLGTTAIPGAIADLTAKVGAPFEGRINQVAQLLFSTGTDALQKQAVLGLTGFREQLLAAGDDQAKVTQILEQAVLTAGDNVTTLAGGAAATFESFEAMKQQVGDAGVETAALARRLRESSEIQNKAAVDYADTIATQKAEVFLPLQKAVGDLYTATFPIFKIALNGITQGVTILTEWFMKAYIKVGGLTGVVETVSNAFTYVYNLLNDFYKSIFGVNDYFGMLYDIVGELWDGLWDFIHNPLKGLKMGFYGLQASFGAFAEYIGDWVSDDLEAWGKALKDQSAMRVQELNEEIAVNRRKREEEDRRIEEEGVSKLFKEMVNADADHFGLVAQKLDESKEVQEQIATNTAPKTTQSSFQTESFQLLSESLDAILGVKPADVQAEMLEELRIANEQRLAQGQQGGGRVETYD
jgi:hypothetical protein